MQEYFELFEKYNIRKKNVTKNIMTMDNSHLIEFIICLLNFSKKPDTFLIAEYKQYDSPYVFFANHALSGSEYPCPTFECRKRNLTETINFALFYADVIFIENYFDKYIENCNPNDNYEKTRISLINDINLLFFLRPLIDKNIIQFVQGYNMKKIRGCFECKKMKLYIDNANEAAPVLLDYMSQKAKINKIETIENKDIFTLSNIEDFYDHDLIEVGIIKDSDDTIIPDNDELKKLYVNDFLNHAITDYLRIQSCVEYVKANFLTNIQLDFELQSLINSKNQPHFLDYSLPYIETNDLSNILEIRENYFDSFLLYRDALTKLFKENPNLENPHDLYFQYLQPEINKIENKFSNSKVIAKNSLRNDLILASGKLAIGLLLHKYSLELSCVSAALGTIDAGSALKNVFGSFEEPNDIKENPYYFLWKCRKHIK